MRRAAACCLIFALFLVMTLPTGVRAEGGAASLAVIGYDPSTSSQMYVMFQEDTVMLKIVVTNATIYLDSNDPREPSNAVYLNITNLTVMAGENKVVNFQFDYHKAGQFSTLVILYTKDNGTIINTREQFMLASTPYHYDQNAENLRGMLSFAAPFIAAFLLQASVYTVANSDVRSRMPSKETYRSSLVIRLQYWPYYWAENGKIAWVILVWLILSGLLGLLSATVFYILLMGFSSP